MVVCFGGVLPAAGSGKIFAASGVGPGGRCGPVRTGRGRHFGWFNDFGDRVDRREEPELERPGADVFQAKNPEFLPCRHLMIPARNLGRLSAGPFRHGLEQVADHNGHYSKNRKESDRRHGWCPFLAFLAIVVPKTNISYYHILLFLSRVIIENSCFYPKNKLKLLYENSYN